MFLLVVKLAGLVFFAEEFALFLAYGSGIFHANLYWNDRQSVEVNGTISFLNIVVTSQGLICLRQMCHHQD